MSETKSDDKSFVERMQRLLDFRESQSVEDRRPSPGLIAKKCDPLYYFEAGHRAQVQNLLGRKTVTEINQYKLKDLKETLLQFRNQLDQWKKAGFQHNLNLMKAGDLRKLMIAVKAARKLISGNV